MRKFRPFALGFSIAIFSYIALAEVSSVTMAARVKSIDGAVVTCETNGVVYKTKKENVRQSPFKVGDSVLVTVPGSEVASLFPASKSKTSK